MDKEELFKGLSDAIVTMDEKRLVDLCQMVIVHHIDVYEAIERGLAQGMERVSLLYERGEYFVPELLICSDVLYTGLELLRSNIDIQNERRRPKVVIGVVEGDTHDIGKNLVKMMLEASGFEIHDLGYDVSLYRFIEKVKEVDPEILAISTLMTTTMGHMKKVIHLLEEENLRNRVKVLVGGGPISQGYANRIGADGYAPDAGAAAKLARKIIND